MKTIVVSNVIINPVKIGIKLKNASRVSVCTAPLQTEFRALVISILTKYPANAPIKHPVKHIIA